MEHDINHEEVMKTKRVCLRLQDARESKNVSISELSRRTKISKKNLELMEECNFDKLPFAPVYRKHFISSYVKALSLDPKPFLEQYQDEEIPLTPPPTPLSKSIYSQPSWSIKFFSYLPNILRSATIMLIAGVVVGYLVLQVRQILEPPSLTVYTPEDGFVVDGNSVVIQGRVEKEAELSINGIGIQHKEDGQFKETINLSDGVNTLIIEARKKHGKITTDTRHVIVRNEVEFSFGVEN